MPLVDIKTSLFTHLEAQGGLPPIHYPNTDGDLPTGDFISPVVSPSNTESIGLATTDQEIGTFRVAIFVKKGKGELEASRIAQIILNAFPRNLALEGVRIDVAGSIRPSFFDENW